jgi:hypothetical protein
MQTLVQPRVAKTASANSKACLMQAKSASGSSLAKRLDNRFLPVLLSALSTWAA